MTLETTQILGAVATLYGLGGALSVLFQARQMHVRGTSGDVSARFLAVYVGGFAVWLLYGLGIGDVPIVVVHAVGLVCGTTTLAVALRLRGSATVAAMDGPGRHRQSKTTTRGVHVREKETIENRRVYKPIQKDAADFFDPCGERVVEVGA